MIGESIVKKVIRKKWRSGKLKLFEQPILLLHNEKKRQKHALREWSQLSIKTSKLILKEILLKKADAKSYATIRQVFASVEKQGMKLVA